MENESISKVLVMIGCVLLVAGAIPAVVAHPDSNTGLANYGTSVGSNSIAGVVGGFAGAAFVNQSGEVAAASGAALCDVEVGDLRGQDSQFVEPIVDGHSSAMSFNARVQDNTWGDGGQGAVCHTPDAHYSDASGTPTDESQWNTPGCGETTDHGFAVATAVHSALPVFVGTSCDLGNLTTGTTDPGGAAAAALCLVNGVFGDGEVPTDCDRHLSSGGGSGFADCQPDFRGDESNFGYASTTQVPVPTQSETQTANGGGMDCVDTDSSASVFVFKTLDANRPGVSGPAATTVWTTGTR